MRVRDRVVRIATVGLFLVVAFLFGNASNAVAAGTGPDFLDELGSQLKLLRAGSDTEIVAARQSDVTISRAERVLVQVYVSGAADDAVAWLQEAGVSVKATGDLPPGGRVSILKDGLPPNDDDEGRAMAGIIYDGAPGLDKLLFASGTNAGPAGKADSINQLVAAAVAPPVRSRSSVTP